MTNRLIRLKSVGAGFASPRGSGRQDSLVSARESWRVNNRLHPGSSGESMSERKAEFSEQLLRHQTQLFGYIYSLVRDLDDADDLFQQTSLALWKKLDQYDQARPFLPWAFGVARYEVSNFLRARSRDRLYFSDELNLLLVECHIELGLDRSDERLSAMAACISKLRRRDQELLDACYGKAVRIPEIAREWGRSTQSIHNSLKRIRQSLYECVRRTMAKEALA
jgi:RNA polymerase sigma-70 factor (ECF subfamily)